MLENVEFKRKFSLNLYKNLKIRLGEMSFAKDFVTDKRGDLYPVLDRSDDLEERVDKNVYTVSRGEVKRFVCRFFPYATFSMSADMSKGGSVGFGFDLPDTSATLCVGQGELRYVCGNNTRSCVLPEQAEDRLELIVSCRPGAFDIYFECNGKAEHFISIAEPSFEDSNLYTLFSEGRASLCACGGVSVSRVSAYIDSGISLADIRSVRYENGDVMVENGRIYLTASVRLQEKMHQGVFSWVPGTAEIDMCGALFYDSGDGRWCGDVAASVIYHRAEKRWYLWVCSFNHDHVLGHACFEGDPRFGVNVVDIELMRKAEKGDTYRDLVGFSGDEDPDMIYDEERGRWLMAVCRLDPESRRYRYVFFESQEPFDGYRYIGRGYEGAETGGSFVRVKGKLHFVCGNDFDLTSNYRIYSEDGMVNAKFDLPDGGFRGWGTLLPVKCIGRTRYFWLTFDRHNGSDYNWSYGNIYCFEGDV